MKMIHRLLVCSLLVMSSIGTLLADSYEVDRTHSAVEFSIRHIISTVHGRFNQFNGRIEFVSSDIGKFSIEMTIEDRSIYTGNERRDRHLRSKDFFYVDSFPTLAFKSTRAYKEEGKGRKRIHIEKVFA